MALGTAEHGGETSNAARVHERRIGGRQLLGDDDRPRREHCERLERLLDEVADEPDRKSTRLNSSHRCISYAVFCLKKKNRTISASWGKLLRRMSRTCSASHLFRSDRGLCSSSSCRLSRASHR